MKGASVIAHTSMHLNINANAACHMNAELSLFCLLSTLYIIAAIMVLRAKNIFAFYSVIRSPMNFNKRIVRDRRFVPLVQEALTEADNGLAGRSSLWIAV